MLLDPRTGSPSVHPIKHQGNLSENTSQVELEQKHAAFKDFNQNLLNAWIPVDDCAVNPHKCKMDGRTIEEMVRLGFTGHVAPYYDQNPKPIAGYVAHSHYCR
jgi:hypothetical protein